MGEEYQEMIDTIYTLLQSMLLAIVLVFIVMTAQFESFFLPFVVIFTLPFALIGVAAFLIVTGSTFNALSGAGCLLLIGVVVNNAIVLVDHIRNLRKQGLSERDSLMKGSEDRLRPIMMTALTTIMGLLPMALGLSDIGSMMYSPLAIAVLGGLVSSTVLTPLIIPLVYSLSDDAIRFLKQVWNYATGQQDS
jgi:HAE1 family hydrophobic/amphiphilic exporter-1